MSGYPPSIKACKLYAKKSANGRLWFAGRMGGLRVAVIDSGFTSESGEAIYNMMFAQAPDERSAGKPGDVVKLVPVKEEGD